MNINGSNVFMGAYEERTQHKYQFNRERITLSEEEEQYNKEQIKKAMKEADWKSANLTISKEDMDFLCSEEGFEKMKKDAGDFYISNAEYQKKIAAGRNPDDPFWSNTGNQWMVFSEVLYNHGFYDSMSDDKVAEMEGILGKITAAMDHVSRNEYNTGLDFSDYYGSGSNFFMSSSEYLTELQSSAAALQAFTDKFVPESLKGKFDELIETYQSHNMEVYEEYRNPLESFNRRVNSMNGGSCPNSGASADYKYSIKSGGIRKTAAESQQFRADLDAIFEKMKKLNEEPEKIWKELEELYADYATDGDADKNFRNYMLDQAKFTFKRMKSYWSALSSN